MVIDTIGIRSHVVLVDQNRSRGLCYVIPVRIDNRRVAHLPQNRSLAFGFWRLDRVIGACSRAPSGVARCCSGNEHLRSVKTDLALDALAKARRKRMRSVRRGARVGQSWKIRSERFGPWREREGAAAVNTKICLKAVRTVKARDCERT